MNQTQHFESGSLQVMTLDKGLAFGYASVFLSFGSRELENVDLRYLRILSSLNISALSFIRFYL